MNSNQLRAILSQHIPESFQSGVYACDQLADIQRSTFAIILNSDISTGPGVHWLAIYKDNTNLEFFDSFGKPIAYYANSKFIKTFLQQYGNKVILNHQQLQSPLTNVCGQYCIYYLVNRINNVTLTNIVNNFSFSNLIKNDDKVENFVRNNFMVPITHLFDNAITSDYLNQSSKCLCKIEKNK
jgi:hypothetical protein